ncbi:MAG TPA: glycosyltransferase, partial [Acidimicrobiia bacterium]
PHPWDVLGINHEWLPPGVAPFHCVPGNRLPQFNVPIAFVGSWMRYGHPEWTHRAEMIQYLSRTYGAAMTLWPPRGRPQLRADELTDLYTSVDIVVGDSCLLPVGDGPYTRFSSDRIPETLGRGGCLVHPWVDGVTDGTLYTAGEHLATWLLGDWDELRGTIDFLNENPDERQKLRDAGQAHVTAWHTYDTRMMHVLTRVLDRVPDGVHLWPETVEAQRRGDGDIESQGAEETPQVPVRATRKPKVPGSRPSPRRERQGTVDADVQPGTDQQVDARPNPRSRKPGVGEGTQEALSG